MPSSSCSCLPAAQPHSTAVAERLRKRLEGDPDVALADVAYTLQVGRRRFEHRRAFVATSRDEAIELLSSGDAKRVVSDVQDTAGSRIVFLFPGQGAQRVNMGRDLYESEPVFRAEIDACSELLRPLLDRDLREILYPSDDRAATAESELSQTAITQPALFATSYALARLWEQWGVTPDAMMGHSLGEYVAASLAGVFSRDDALTLVARRALLMQEVPHGSMLAVRATVDDVSPLLTPALSIAGLNAPNLTVVSGPSDAVSALAEELHGRGVASRELVTSHAFHSEMMDPVLDRFAAVVAELPRQAPVIPFVSSLTGDWITAEEATDPGYWARQLREPVRFADGVGRLLEDPANVYVEVGPGRTLTTLLRQHPDGSSSQSRRRLHGERGGREHRHLVDAHGREVVCGSPEPAWTGPASTAVAGAGACSCRPIRSSASATGSSLHPGRVAPMSFRVSRRTASPCHRRPRLPRSP